MDPGQEDSSCFYVCVHWCFAVAGGLSCMFLWWMDLFLGDCTVICFFLLFFFFGFLVHLYGIKYLTFKRYISEWIALIMSNVM